jgi:predicted amidohydrolase
MPPSTSELTAPSPPVRTLRVAALQMVSTPRVEENLRTAAALMSEAVAQGAELLALPEYFAIMGMSDRDKVRACASTWATARSRISWQRAPANTACG